MAIHRPAPNSCRRDLSPFFSNPANRNAVYRLSPGAKSKQPHALVLIGYNDKDKYWIAR